MVSEMGIRDSYVRVASRANQIKNEEGFAPLGCYSWNSYYSGAGSYLYADGSYVQGFIPKQSSAGSTIEVIVDQNNSTIQFWLEGAPVGNGGTACKLTVKPEHKGDLTPAACVMNGGSALTLVAVEAVARIEGFPAGWLPQVSERVRELVGGWVLR